MTADIQCEQVAELAVGNELGEGAIWDASRRCFWWVDIMGSTLFRCNADGDALEQYSMPERLACLAPIEGSELFLGGFESGFATFTPAHGVRDWLQRIEADNPGNRMNDGGTDRQGRFWAGTMVEDADRSTGMGSLYRMDADRSVHAILHDLSIPNSLAFSPDSDVMYHCCSVNRQILAYDYDASSGLAANPRVFVETVEGVSPDGSAVDAQGRLWNAQWGGHRVACYAANGEQQYALPLDVPQPTCVAFGGDRLDHLLVTTARQGMTEDDLRRYPSSGNTYLYRCNVTGLADAPFAG
ncbi:MAG: SMP-30/gluconolactonase/LRE family protein [Pseudomonadota bacterium]